MAMGGLRVRLMRSIVTLISVVLAIGFLFYMGMSSKLVSNLAHATQPTQFPVEKLPALAAAASALAERDFVSQLSQSQKDQLVDQVFATKETDSTPASAARPTDQELRLKLTELFTQKGGRIPSLADGELRGLQLLLGWAGQDDHASLMLEALESEQLARESIAIDRLLRKNLISAKEQLESGNPMDTWLILMALLTCAVGITNAMLMSVTERFREIGTMKCLGAQDRLVVQLFLIESGLLGVVGSAGGIVLGIAVALAAAALQFKGYGMQYFPWLGGLTVIGWSIVAGVLISVFGAVYPARVAARMNPVDALRIDE